VRLSPGSNRRRRCLSIALILVLSWAHPLFAQAPATPKPATQAKPPAKPLPKKAPAPTTKPAAKPPEPAPPPPPPPPEDVHFKASYTTGDQKTETVTFVKGARERFEFQDMVLLKQHDQKRIIQISLAAKTYYVTPEDQPVAPPPAAAPGVPPRPPGVVTVATTIVDTGDRKTLFGQQARHVKSIIDRQPMLGACDMSKQRVETDGWYIDTPKLFETQALTSPTAAVSTTCNDQITATHNGDPKVLGFPMAYTTTVIGDDGKPAIVTMEVSEFEVTTLDAAIFEIPQGLNAALNLGELGQALSNANEAKLAAENAAASAAPVVRKPGVIRIGVPELTNKTGQTVDTRALRAELISHLTDAKFEVLPLAAAPQGELQKRAADRGLDYLLMAEVTELKVSKGGVGGAVRAASRIGSSATPQKEPTEASVQVKLLQADGKQQLSTTARGKDSAVFTAQTGMGLARLAGSMSFMMGPGMMLRMYQFSSLSGTNLGGMGMLGNPGLFQTQAMTMGGMGLGRGSVDQTAGAASYLMQQAMAMRSSSSAGAAGGPSFDEALNEAFDNASKAVVKSLEKK
jgi:hypothetical protein